MHILVKQSQIIPSYISCNYVIDT